MTDTVATGSLAGTERLDRQSLFLLFIGLFATAIGQAFVFAISAPAGAVGGPRRGSHHRHHFDISACLHAGRALLGTFLGQDWSQACDSYRTDGLLHWFACLRRAVLTLQDKA